MRAACRRNTTKSTSPSVHRRIDRDLTIVTLGPALCTAVRAAGDLAARSGSSAEKIGLRSANPMNHNLLADSIRKAGTVLLISDTLERGSVMRTFAANLTQILFYALDAPLGCAPVREPDHPGAGTGDHVLPHPEWLIDSIN